MLSTHDIGFFCKGYNWTVRVRLCPIGNFLRIEMDRFGWGKGRCPECAAAHDTVLNSRGRSLFKGELILVNMSWIRRCWLFSGPVCCIAHRETPNSFAVHGLGPQHKFHTHSYTEISQVEGYLTLDIRVS